MTGTTVFTHFKFSPWNSADLDAVLGCWFRVEVVCATDVSREPVNIHLQNRSLYHSNYNFVGVLSMFRGITAFSSTQTEN